MRYDKGIKRVLDHAKISAAELARRTRLSESFVSELLAGRASPSERTLEAIGEACGVPPELIALAGADAEDLRGLTPETAQELVGHLLDALRAKNEVTRPKRGTQRLPLDVVEIELQDGRLRLAFFDGSDKSPVMQSTCSYHPRSIKEMVANAVSLNGQHRRDERGLYWETREARYVALQAARNTLRRRVRHAR